MGLTLRQLKGSSLTISEMDSNFTYLDNLITNLSASTVSDTLYTEVDITAAQIRTSFSVPVEILPQLVSGNYYVIEKMVVIFTPGSVTFSGFDGKPILLYWMPNYYPFAYISSGMFLETLGEDCVTTIMGGASITDGGGTYVPYQIRDNTKLELVNNYDSGVGNGTCKFKIWYTVESF